MGSKKMKFRSVFYFFLFFLVSAGSLYAQNIGIGTGNPQSRLHVYNGNLLIQNSIPYLILSDTTPSNGKAGLLFRYQSSSLASFTYDVYNDFFKLTTDYNGTRPDFIVNTDGHVGIGITEPMGELHVFGDTVADLFLTPSATGSSYDSRIVLAEDNDNTWGMSIRYDGGANQLRIFGKDDNVINGPHLVIDRDGGNVGIGIDDPGDRLDVDGNITSHSDFYAYSASPMVILDNTGSTNQGGIIMKQQGTPAGWVYYDYNYDVMTLNTDPVGTRRDLVIDIDGNVGVGLYNPSEKLHVSGGDIKIDDSYPFLYLNSSSSAANSGVNFTSTAGDYCSMFYNHNLNELTFSVGSSTPDAVMTTSGYLGLGTTDPVTRLHVRHASGTSNGLSIQNSYDSDRWHYYVYNGNDLGLFFNDSYRGAFDDVTGTYTAASDRRLKKNIDPLESVLDNVMKLQPHRYQFLSQGNSNTRYLGFVAQEVEGMFPSLVHYQDESDVYTLDYSGFGVLAIKAIQEQQSIIDSQQKQIDELLKRIENLENQ